MFFTGLAIFSGAALLLAKLRRRWLLKASGSRSGA